MPKSSHHSIHQPSDIILQSPAIQLKDVDLDKTIKGEKKQYLKKLKYWQEEMLKVQQAYFHQNKRAVIVFEGWDASGKGGAIRRITEKLDPRGFSVHPISAPTAEEQGIHYLQRFQTKLPRAGTIAIFDRSWYGRVLVERVESFATEHQWQRAYQEINEFERLLSDDDVRIIKIFLHINQDEQLYRFEERLNNPHKRWKLTEEDIRNRLKWNIYEQAIDDMIALTSTEQSPWSIIPSNHKWYARIEVLKTVVKAMRSGVDTTPPPIDPDIVKAAYIALGVQVNTDA